jgi:glycine dehydrogenase subunit 1
MRYLPHTEQEVRAMLDAAQRGSVDELFETIPEKARLKGDLNLPPALGEARLMRHLTSLSERNEGAKMLSFLGCGAYAHHIPPAVDQLLLRSEFYTAYTPYQPEVAQGTLLAIWEFQTLVSELYGLPLANASLYDGASATAEAVLMARRVTKRSRVILSGCVHPDYRATTVSYLSEQARDVVTVPVGDSGSAHVGSLIERLDDSVACVVVGYPSYLGPLSDLRLLSEKVHAHGALLVVAVGEPYALGLAEPPGALGADIVAGEGQPMAISPQFGGPGVGLFACRDERRFLQQLPGRVCGETVDQDGKRGYVLTLSTREQHIRRERATSNICTNQGLIALAFTIRTSLLGKGGFRAVALDCLAKSEYLKAELSRVPGLKLVYPSAPSFNEFAVELAGTSAAAKLAALEAEGILGGVDLGRYEPERKNQILLAVTELHTREDLDRLVAAFRAA